MIFRIFQANVLNNHDCILIFIAKFHFLFRLVNETDDVNSTVSVTKNGTRSQDKNLSANMTGEQDDVLDCGKAVNFTYYDYLVGVNNRHNHPHVPEPQVALIFNKNSSKNNEFDVDALERKLKKAKREV